MIRSYFLVRIALLFVASMTHAASQDPWLTGPLLALTAQVTPVGHSQFEIFEYQLGSRSAYDTHYIVEDTPYSRSSLILPTFRYGFAQNFDVEWDILFQFNSTQGHRANNFGDTLLIVNYQLFKQEGLKQPDVNISLSETLPSGRYDRLNPDTNGVDATGAGSFQTALGLNMQYLTLLAGDHYLNLYVNVGYQFASGVSLHGLSSYGGNDATNGHLQPGNQTYFDLATELTFTQNWVGVMELYYEYETKSHFRGDPGDLTFNANGVTTHPVFPSNRNLALSGIGYENRNILSLAPAIEYNFSATYGVIAGVWFSVFGKYSPKFIAPAIAFNANW